MQPQRRYPSTRSSRSSTPWSCDPTRPQPRPERGETRMSTRRKILVALAALAAMIVPLAASAAPPAGPGSPELLATLAGNAASGSAIGPGGALFVPQPAAGQIWRIDPDTGNKTLFASGLPQRFGFVPFGGVMDVAFYGSTAYALVSVVEPGLLACDPGLI